LVEIAAIKFVDGCEAGRLVSLVDPQEHIPSAATAVHGITAAMVRGKPRAAEVLKEFRAFIEGAVLVAHYAAFDLRIVNDELQRARLPLLKNAHVCTRNLSRRHLPNLWDHKLATVARHLNLMKGQQEHRALGDALLVAGIYHRLVGDSGVCTATPVSSMRVKTTAAPSKSTTGAPERRRAGSLGQTPNQIAKGVFLCECGYKLVFDPDHLRADKLLSKQAPISLPDRPRSKHSIFLWRGSVLHVSCHLGRD
jgi:DNA polymerase III epsilon subunit family exonuclease